VKEYFALEYILLCPVALWTKHFQSIVRLVPSQTCYEK
jgi:hypothetical protein